MRPEPVRLSLDASTLICAVATVAVLFLAIIGVGTAVGGEAVAAPTPPPPASTSPAAQPCEATLTLVTLKGRKASYLLVVHHDGPWTVTWPRQADDRWQSEDKPEVTAEGDRVRVAGTGKQEVGIAVEAAKSGLRSIPETECATT